MPEPYECTARVRRPAWSPVASIASLLAFSVVPAWLRSFFGGTAILVALVAMIVAQTVVVRRSRVKRTVQASASGLRIGGRLVLPRGSIRAARVALMPAGKAQPSALELSTYAALGAHTIVPDDAEHAFKLKEALALDETQSQRTTGTFGVSREASMLLMLLLLVPAALLGFFAQVWLARFLHESLWSAAQVIVTTASLFAVGMLLPVQSAEIAADGVRITRKWSVTGRVRYIAFPDVRNVVQHGTRVKLELANGAPYVMPFFNEQLAASAASVLREGLAASAGKHALPPSALERGGRSHDEWLAALRTFGRGATERSKRWRAPNDKSESGSPHAREGSPQPVALQGMTTSVTSCFDPASTV